MKRERLSVSFFYRSWISTYERNRLGGSSQDVSHQKWKDRLGKQDRHLCNIIHCCKPRKTPKICVVWYVIDYFIRKLFVTCTMIKLNHFSVIKSIQSSKTNATEEWKKKKMKKKAEREVKLYKVDPCFLCRESSHRSKKSSYVEFFTLVDKIFFFFNKLKHGRI